MKKLLSVVISMCLLFSALSFPTAVTAETVTPEQETTLVTESTDVTLQENSEETTEFKEPCADSIYAKTVDNGDGTKTLTLYDHPVRFVNENGELQDISLEIAAGADGTYKTLAAESQTVFPKNISEGITLSGNGVSLKMTPATANTAGSSSSRLTANAETQKLSASVTKLDQKTVSYTYDSKTTLEYQLTYTGFKEDIVVSEYTGQTEYCFLLETGGLTLTKIDGSYYLTDENGEIKATIGDIIIFTADERNNTLGSMSHTVVRENQQYILTIHVDADYLSDENTKYPIRIDPTIEITYDNNGAGAIQDAVIYSAANTNGSSGSLYIGLRENYGIARALVQFPTIDFTDFNPTDILDVSLEIRDLMCQSNELAIEAYIFTGGSWTESTVSWTAVQPHNMAFRQDTIYVSYANGVSLSPKHRYPIDITVAARNWASGNYNQYGIILKTNSTVEYGSTYVMKTFASYNRASNKPSLTIKYVDPNAVSPPEGELESVTSTNISGWAYVPDAPAWSVRIKLVLTNNTYVSESPDPIIFSTSLYRDDLEEAGYGNGPHGFSYNISWDDFVPGEYTVYAYAEDYYGNWVLLSGAPKTYSKAGLTLDKYVITLDRGHTASLRAYSFDLNGTEDSVTFQSSNPNIITVESLTSTLGFITALKSGTATIQVRSELGNYSRTCTVTVLKSAIIIVPGIMGTELVLAYDQNGLPAGTKVWPPLESNDDFNSDDTAALAKLFSIECTDTGTSKYDLIVYNDDNYGTYDMYKELYDDLTESYNSKHDIIFFGYDWRQSNAVSGDLLSDRVNQYDKVIIVAHSMGGLVASHMLTNASARAKVINFISIGTPFLGTPGTHLLVSHGEYSVFDETLDMDWPTDSVVKEILQRLAVNIPSVYELYPTEKYFSFGNDGYLSLKTHLGSTTHYNTFSDTRDNLIYATNGHMNGVFNNDLFDEATDNHELLWIGEEHITSYVNSYYICGTSYKTINHVLIDMNIVLDDLHDETEVDQGDSVVLSCSASINDLYSSRTFYTALTHNDLLKGNGVEFVKRLINNNTNLPGGFYNNEADALPN